MCTRNVDTGAFSIESWMALEPTSTQESGYEQAHIPPFNSSELYMSNGFERLKQDVREPGSTIRQSGFYCETCHKAFTAKRSLRRRQRQNVKHLAAIDRPAPDPHSCDLCGNDFARKHDLQRHRREIHELNERRNVQHIAPTRDLSSSSLHGSAANRQDDGLVNVPVNPTWTQVADNSAVNDVFQSPTARCLDWLDMSLYSQHDAKETDTNISHVSSGICQICGHFMDWEYELIDAGLVCKHCYLPTMTFDIFEKTVYVKDYSLHALDGSIK